MTKDKSLSKGSGMARWIVLLCLSVPMFGSYFFADMLSPLSEIFKTPDNVALGWNSAEYGLYTGAYSILCVFGGLVICGILLDRWGVRITGTIFVALMIAGGFMVFAAFQEGFDSTAVGKMLGEMFAKPSLAFATAGCALFGLGSEIAGVAVNRSIAKWFKHKGMALAMGLQLALARLGKATALLTVPMMITIENGYLSYDNIFKICIVAMMLLVISGVVWSIFVGLDARADRLNYLAAHESSSDKFRWSDVLKVLSNRHFLMISLLCVTFYSCIISFSKFASAVAIPRFGIDYRIAGQMISMIPFCTIVFAPLFGHLVDRAGNGTRFMILGSVLVFIAHLTIAIAPGMPAFGYIGIGILGIGYSLVPAAMWPSVPKIIPEKNLGTAYSLIYWIQNMGLLAVPIAVGAILDRSESIGAEKAAVFTEIFFLTLASGAIAVSLLLRKESLKHPELELDSKR